VSPQQFALTSSVVSQVRGASQLHAVSEKTQLLLEIDELWLPIMIKCGLSGLSDESNFPKWIHVLLPNAGRI
jgi:hypothetical protein